MEPQLEQQPIPPPLPRLQDLTDKSYWDCLLRYYQEGRFKEAAYDEDMFEEVLVEERYRVIDECTKGIIIYLKSPTGKEARRVKFSLEDSEEIFQVYSIRLFRSRTKWNGGPLHPWFKMILTNTVIDHLRKTKTLTLHGKITATQFRHDDDDMEGGIVEPQAMIEEPIIILMSREVGLYLSRISNTQYRLIIEYDLQGMTTPEIAAALGIDAQSVYRGRFRAIQEMRCSPSD